METVTISKDEYIDLLKCKAMATTTKVEAPAPVKKGGWHTWLNPSEKAEIMRLYDLGWRSLEIGREIERASSTVRRVIQQEEQRRANTPEQKVQGDNPVS